MCTSRDNRKLAVCIRRNQTRKETRSTSPASSFFQTSFPWDPSIVSLSINWGTPSTYRSPRESGREAHGLHCQDDTKPHLQSCWWGLMQNSLRSWTGKEVEKAVVGSSSPRDKIAFYLEVWWYTQKTNPEGLQWFAGAEGPETCHKACFGEEGVAEAHWCSGKPNHFLWGKSIFLDFSSSTKGVYDPV